MLSDAFKQELPMKLPYASARAKHARDQITAMLRRFGCEQVGIGDDFSTHEVVLAFTHRGREVKLRASAKGWAQMYLKQRPWNAKRRVTPREYEQLALRQGRCR
jgi:microsomal dipeptidase-like Zn-dependent dipeptidase